LIRLHRFNLTAIFQCQQTTLSKLAVQEILHSFSLLYVSEYKISATLV